MCCCVECGCVLMGRTFQTKGMFIWDQSGRRIIGIMHVSICLGAILIPEYLGAQ